MYASIRKYKTNPGMANELAQRVNEGFVPIINKAPGFMAYYVVDAGSDIVASVSIFQDLAGSEESNRMAAAWVKENVASYFQGPPEITAGEVTVQTSASRKFTFNQMAAEAFTSLPVVKPDELYRWLQQEPKPFVIDVQDAADVALMGTIPGAVNISFGSLTYKADHELPEDWRDARLNDHALLIVTTCAMGPFGALGGKLLRDMGFTNVYILEGGVQAWMEAGYPVQQPA